jgi:hypothetical protein
MIIQRLMQKFRGHKPAPSPPATPREPGPDIDALMAGPVKEAPKILVFGDEAVVGINPAPPSN